MLSDESYAKPPCLTCDMTSFTNSLTSRLEKAQSWDEICDVYSIVSNRKKWLEDEGLDSDPSYRPEYEDLSLVMTKTFDAIIKIKERDNVFNFIDESEYIYAFMEASGYRNSHGWWERIR